MSERLPEWQPMGVKPSDFGVELKTPEQEKLEHKKLMYEAVADILVESVNYLEQDQQEIKVLGSGEIAAALSRAVSRALENVEAEDAVAIMQHATRSLGMGPAGDYWTDKSAPTALKATIQRGIGTGSDVMSAYWKMIKNHYGEGDLYRIATSDTSMKTLIAITRAWSLGEISEKLRGLGGSFDDYGGSGQVIPGLVTELFEFREDGVVLSREHMGFFRSGMPEEKAVCPAGHMVGNPDHDAETAAIMPIREYARILLDKWQAGRQKAQDTL